MPYLTHPATTAYDPSQSLPQHLDHKPVFALPYQAFDGPYAGPNTDIRFISVGLAQYDPDELSVKTMRYTGSKWTRQAEELPPHRVADMALMLAKTVFDQQNGTVTLPSGTLQNQTSEVVITQEQRTFGEMASYNAAVAKHQTLLKDRFNALLDVLNDLKARGLL